MAVSFLLAMGLLDDAIREHLELKRLRGADPGEVAREQQEALAPVLDEPADSSEYAHDEGEAGSVHVSGIARVGATSTGHDLAGAPEFVRGADGPSAGQETAELDMRTVLDEDPVTPGMGVSSETEPGDRSVGAHYEQDSLEWEDVEVPTQEHTADPGQGEAAYEERPDPGGHV
jgi:hypothetical protein